MDPELFFSSDALNGTDTPPIHIYMSMSENTIT